MFLSEIEKKGIKKGQIWKNAVTGYNMLVMSIERHDRPAIGHYLVRVQTSVPGEISTIPQEFNDINFFGVKISDSEHDRDPRAGVQSSTKSTKTNKIKASNRNNAVKRDSVSEPTFDDPVEEYLNEEENIQDFTVNKRARNQMTEIPKDPADELLEDEENNTAFNH